MPTHHTTIHRILYQSESLLTGTDADVRDQVAAIVAASKLRNCRDGLTGALLFTNGLFIQVLEGNAAALEATFERICRDVRHRRVVLHEFSEASGRVFAGWGMTGVPGASADDALMFPAPGEAARPGRNRALAAGALNLMRGRLDGMPARGG